MIDPKPVRNYQIVVHRPLRPPRKGQSKEFQARQCIAAIKRDEDVYGPCIASITGMPHHTAEEDEGGDKGFLPLKLSRGELNLIITWIFFTHKLPRWGNYTP